MKFIKEGKNGPPQSSRPLPPRPPPLTLEQRERRELIELHKQAVKILAEIAEAVKHEWRTTI